MSDRKRVPLKIGDQVIGEAEVTVTEEGVLFEVKIPSPGPEVQEQLQHTAMSFSACEPNPDLVPHDSLAQQPPLIRQEDELS